tara:strand:+ start:124744 stop:125343 length:600 start_codon:yes stop_codon:yes gene_type:complete
MSAPQRIALADRGELLLWPKWLEDGEARALFDELSATLSWQQRSLTMFGKTIPEPRMSAWIGDPDAAYSYSGRAHEPADWSPPLARLRTQLQELLNHPLNSVLANLYRGEQDSMGWHADNERELGNDPTIASVSLGATRRFWLKHANAKTVRLELGHGSLLVMQGSTQHHWKHCVPKETSHREPRINLTFRRIGNVPQS